MFYSFVLHPTRTQNYRNMTLKRVRKTKFIRRVMIKIYDSLNFLQTNVIPTK